MPEIPVFRYLDVCLVLATAPFVIAAGMPLLGYLIGARRVAADLVWAPPRCTHARYASAIRARAPGCRSA